MEDLDLQHKDMLPRNLGFYLRGQDGQEREILASAWRRLNTSNRVIIRVKDHPSAHLYNISSPAFPYNPAPVLPTGITAPLPDAAPNANKGRQGEIDDQRLLVVVVSQQSLLVIPSRDLF